METTQRNRDENVRLQPIFYTYVWYMIKDGEHIPFYVGKGKLRRYTAEAHFYNLEFKRIYDKYQCYYRFAIENVTDYESIEKEKELIKLYGRRDLKQGTLINHTNGGDGTAGYRFTGEKLLKQRNIIMNTHKDPIINNKRIKNLRISVGKIEHKNKLSKLVKERYKNDNTCFDAWKEGNKKMWADPVRRQQVVNNMKASFTEERRKQLSESAINSWTDERKEQKSKELIERYSNPEERQKQSEIVKEAMSKLPKEKLSRRHVSKLSIETLLDMVENRHLTQKQMAEKYNITIANAKGIKSGKHWIYDHMRENNIPIKELPKNQKFRCSVSTEVLLNIVKDKDMKRSELFEKYNNVSQKIIGQIRNGSHWIYEYIEENKII